MTLDAQFSAVLPLEGEMVCIMHAHKNNNIFLSSRNIKTTKVILASELNTHDIVNANKLIMMQSSISEIEKNLN